MKCQLCGFSFDKKEADVSCSGCVLRKGCSLLRCPNCGFEFPKESKIINFLTKKEKRKDDEK